MFSTKREVLVCSEDPFDDGISDLVVDRPVVGTTDEELVLMGEERKDGCKPEERQLKWFRLCF